METSASFEARSAPSSYPTTSQAGFLRSSPETRRKFLYFRSAGFQLHARENEGRLTKRGGWAAIDDGAHLSVMLVPRAVSTL